ncbi:S1C family serine protease [Ruania zhangjianzhongii]|uniref:S1C family serine protease n=1 Tax=Ruania zhangjianzhongii TaxID=2603206 RepID=UPI0011C8BFB2|nr:trypsin-like peptidase domain-containing protein [Ruania zhangjianzhongii]
MTSNDPQQQPGQAPTYSWTSPGSFSTAPIAGPHAGADADTSGAPADAPVTGQPGATGQAPVGYGPSGSGYSGAEQSGPSPSVPVQPTSGYGAPHYGAASHGAPHYGAAEQIPSYGAASATTTGVAGPSGPGQTPPPSGPGQTPPQHPAPGAGNGKQRKGGGKQWLLVGTAAVLAAALASGGTALVLQDQPGSSEALVQVPSTSTNVASNSDGSPDWQSVATAVRPSVVAISVATQQGEGAGSGVIIDAENGYVLTNNHVVDGAEQIAVTLADGRMFQAQSVGTDPATDLAVLQLTDPPDDLTAATLGTSDSLEVGQSVMAVGNPLGLDSTVTTGIISALDRPVGATDQFSREQVVTNAIQIDAAINPGNSGGPLFDSAGHVIGITSSIATDGQSNGSIGLGFAIPVDLVTTIADQLIENGSAEHAYLGVSLTNGTAKADGATRAGAEVHEVVDGTPAAQAGLQPGDVIVKIDDDTVGGAESLTGYVRTYSSGDEVTLTVVREGAEQEITATLATREDVAS